MNSTVSQNVDLLANYEYIAFGSMEILVNCIICFTLLTDKQYLIRSAFIVGLAGGDFIHGLALLISGAQRMSMAMTGKLNNTVHPYYCIKSSFTSLFLLGNLIPSLMFLLIGIERFSAVRFFAWYRLKWSNTVAWILTASVYSYAVLSLIAAAILVGIQPDNVSVSVTCVTPLVVGQIYSVYNYGISVFGGTVAVLGTVASIVTLRIRYRPPTTSKSNGDNNQFTVYFKKEWRQSRLMLYLSILDLGLVVVPNILLILVGGFQIKIQYLNVAVWSIQIISLRSILNIVIYIWANREFRNCLLKIITFKRIAVLPTSTESNMVYFNNTNSVENQIKFSDRCKY